MISWDRPDAKAPDGIVMMSDHGKVLFVTTQDLLQRGYLVKPTRALSNQRSFLTNAGRLLSEGSREVVTS